MKREFYGKHENSRYQYRYRLCFEGENGRRRGLCGFMRVILDADGSISPQIVGENVDNRLNDLLPEANLVRQSDRPGQMACLKKEPYIS